MDSRIKITAAFLIIISITAAQQWYFPFIILIASTAFVLRLNAIRGYCKNLIFPLVLGLFILVVQSFTYAGMEYGILLFSRILASASVLILLSLTTSENEMLETMRWFRFPRTIIEISSFMSRYIKTFFIEGKKLKQAQESRCGFSGSFGFKKRMQNIASMCGLLILRAFSRSEEVYRAMLSRAWKYNTR
jgi:cobalt/nickel transport system permease protein